MLLHNLVETVIHIFFQDPLTNIKFKITAFYLRQKSFVTIFTVTLDQFN